MTAPKCPAAMDALVLTDGVVCVAVYDRARLLVIHFAGDIGHTETVDGAFHFAERLSVDDPTMRATHVDYTVYVRGGLRTSVVAIIRPGGKVSKSINRSVQAILKKAEADMGPACAEPTPAHGQN